MIVRPEPTSRHVLIVFLMTFTAAIGVSLFLGAPAPTSIAAQLPPLGVALWALALLIGSLMSLAGLALQQPGRREAIFMKGVQFEVVGMAIVGPPAMIYAAAAIKTVGASAAFPAGVTFVFGAACSYRALTLVLQIVRGRRAMKAKGVIADGEH